MYKRRIEELSEKLSLINNVIFSQQLEIDTLQTQLLQANSGGGLPLEAIDA